MSNRYQNAVTKPLPTGVIAEASPGFAGGPLEVNVIFTDASSTAGALRLAGSLAKELGAHISLRAVIAVPFQLPLERPPVSVAFLQDTLRELVSGIKTDGLAATAHVYLCRDRVRALLQALKPNSLVIIAGHKRWWPTPESRMADALRSKGHRVIFVDSGVASGSERPAVVAR